MVWDLPTRLFHWSFGLSIAGAYISGERGALGVHEIFSLLALGLIVFRLIWGVIGYETARFSHFLVSPARVLAYLRAVVARTSVPHNGHNPLGGLAVVALLSVMGAMAITGLWTGDDILYEAPLPLLGIAPELAAPMGAWHQDIHKLVIPLIALHVLAIVAHRLWLREKLVSRMIGGGEAAQKPTRRQTLLGLALLVFCVGASLSLAWVTPNFI